MFNIPLDDKKSTSLSSCRLLGHDTKNMEKQSDELKFEVKQSKILCKKIDTNPGI